MSDPLNTGGDAAPDSAADAASIWSPELDDLLKSRFGIDPSALNRMLETAREVSASSQRQFAELCRQSADGPEDSWRWDPRNDVACRHFGLDPASVRAFYEELYADPQNRRILNGGTKAAYQPPAKIAFEPANPWPAPVAARELVSALTTTLRAYMSISENGALLAALWILHTHAIEAFDTSPRLVIRSAHPVCGKSRLILMLSHLVPKPLQLCAAAARALQDTLGFTPTLLIDDAAGFLRNPMICTILRNGRQRTGAYFLRSAGKEAQSVTVFTPAAIAIHGKMPPLLATRSIELRLEPKKPADTIRPISGADELKSLCSMAARWAHESAARLRQRQDNWPPGGDENWTPLRIIAAEAGEEWESRLFESIKHARAENGSPLQLLLADIRELLRRRTAGEITLKGPKGADFTDRDRIRSRDLARLLAELEGQPWNEWGRTASAITPHGLAAILVDANVRPVALRFNLLDGIGCATSIVERGYSYEHLNEAFARYLDGAAAASEGL